jgi:FMN phosphatase YigB (HAD superfamily)
VISSSRVYRLAVDRLQLPAARIGFVSSNGWDAIGAKAFGFTAFWINRAGAPVDRHAAAGSNHVDARSCPRCSPKASTGRR